MSKVVAPSEIGSRRDQRAHRDFLHTFSQRHTELAAERAKLEEQRELLGSEKQNLVDDIETIRAECDRLATKLEAARRRTAKMTSELEATDQKSMTLKRDIEETRQRVSEQQNEASQLEGEVEEYRCQLSLARRRCQALVERAARMGHRLAQQTELEQQGRKEQNTEGA